MTLLAFIAAATGTEAQVIAKAIEALKNGTLVLTGNFRGQEQIIAAQLVAS